MNSKRIFFQRVIKYWKYQYDVIKSIADWTVLLYIIIPACVFIFFVYRSWWLDIPVWINHVPFYFLLIIGYLLAWSGNIRTFVESGDKVFLIKKFPIFWGVKKHGYFYSLINQAIFILFYFILLLPFLINHFFLNWSQIIPIAFYFVSLSPIIMLGKYQLRKIESRIKTLFYRMISFIALSWFSQAIYLLWKKGILLPLYFVEIGLLVLGIFLSLGTLKKVSYIDYEINMEQEEKLKFISLIFRASNEIETPEISKRTKPLFLRKSKRLLNKRSPVNGFVELYLKMFLRNSSHFKSFLQILSITMVTLVIVPPLWLKILIIFCIIIMIYIWLSAIWNKIMSSNPLIKKYQESDFYFKAKSKGIILLFTILVLILSIVAFITIMIKAQI